MSTVTSPWWRNFNGRSIVEREPGWEPGITTLESGRSVYDTGKVLIGLHHQDRDYHRELVDQGRSADWGQSLLLDTKGSPITRVGRSFKARLMNVVWWVVGWAVVGALFYVAAGS